MGAELSTPSAPAGTALPINSCRSSAAKRSRTGNRCKFFRMAGASDWPMAISFLQPGMPLVSMQACHYHSLRADDLFCERKRCRL
jgi:hypothetical protein